MKPLSANKAAQVAHKTKQTILDAINDNTLSAEKNKRGHWEIDPSELNRVFPYEIRDQSQDQSPTPIKTDKKTNETSLLEVELKADRRLIERLEAEIDDLKAQRDEWMGQAKTLALTDQRGQGGKRGFLERMFGR